jgi:hypothetical protein
LAEANNKVFKKLDELEILKAAAVKSGNAEAVTKINQQINDLSNTYSKEKKAAVEPLVKEQKTRFTAWFSDKYGQDVSSLKPDDYNSEKFNEVARNMLNNFSGQVPLDAVYTELGNRANVSEINPKGTGVQKIKAFDVGTSDGLILPGELASDLMGKDQRMALGAYSDGFFPISTLDATPENFIKQWDSGAVRNISIVPRDRAITYTDRYGDVIHAVKAEAYIPVESFVDGKISMDTWFGHEGKERMRRDFNARKITDKDDQDYMVFDVYYPISNSSFGNYVFDRQKSKEYYDAKQRREFEYFQRQNAFGE